MAEGRDLRGQELARLMLRKAEQDLHALLTLRGSVEIAVEILGFHAQQSVEKALKAALIRHGIQHEYVHNLSVLAGQIEGAGMRLPVGIDTLEALTPFAVQLRYTVFDDPPAFDVAQAVATAESVAQWARDIVEAPLG